MTYVEAFIAAVPTANKDAFIAHCERCAVVFKEFGALSVTECWGVQVPEGDVTSFPMAVKATPEETVTISWIVWPSKAHRDQIGERLMADPRFAAEMQAMPFDGKRAMYGGFEPVLQA